MDSKLTSQLASQLSGALQQRSSTPGMENTQGTPYSTRVPSKSPSKARSLSDSTPKLSPSPKFREPARRSKDDHSIIPNPQTPKKPDFIAQGLSLQMPARENNFQNPVNFMNRVPLSPQLDARNTYGSPTSVLPRHSRGLEFSRACTNLHHSTLAEQSSPDSSPTITQKGIAIPSRRKRSNSMVLDSPNTNSGSLWTTMGTSERIPPSSSVGSINMLGSDSSSSSSDELDPMEPDDNEDALLMTPQVTKATGVTTPFGVSFASPGNNGWGSNFSAATSSFMNYQRARLKKGRSRKSSSSASGRSSIASPGPGSPPQGRNIDGNNASYFNRDSVMRTAASRRESLSIVANDLHISSGNDSGDEAGKPTSSTPGVIRRAVTRRGNLLPKIRAFNRLKAELIEESQPVDSEARREAEIIRQVRESDADYDVLQPSTAQSSPTLMPSIPGGDSSLEGIGDNGMNIDMGAGSNSKGLFGAFNLQPLGNPPGQEFWNNIPNPPPAPPAFLPRGNSSAISEDVNMDSTSLSSSVSMVSSSQGQGQCANREQRGSRSSTPQPAAPPTAQDALKKNNKRRRDDDFDVSSLKRRAVSPGMSVQNSPILSQSPGQRDSGIWGAPKTMRDGSATGHAAGERSNSGGSVASTTPALGPKRVGLQGMTDTNDGLMKMSIE